MAASKLENVDLNTTNDKQDKQDKHDKQDKDKDNNKDKEESKENKDDEPRKFQLGSIASGMTKALSSTIKKTVNAASAVIMSDNKENDKQESLYRGDYSKDMKEAKWKPTKKLIANPGSIVRRQKRVLVTGGAGFIGSHLVDALMEKGYDVICADNLYSGQKCNVYKWFGNPNFEFIRHDVCNPLYVEVDEIYHLACPASPVFYQNNPIKTVKVCMIMYIQQYDMSCINIHRLALWAQCIC